MRPSSLGPRLEKVAIVPTEGARWPPLTASAPAPMVMMFLARPVNVMDW